MRLGGPPLPVHLAWNTSTLLWLLPAAAAYAALLRAHAARTTDAPATRRQMIHFSLGLFALWVALGTPLAPLADRYLFSAHMLQVVLVAFVAPPLLLLGMPDWLLRPAFRRPLLARVVRTLTHPVVAMLLFNILFSILLLPVIYEASLHSATLRALAQTALVASAACMWWPLVSRLPEAPPLSDPLQILYLFAQIVLETVAFVLVTFAPAPLYATYAHAPRLFGLTALEDQQIGGAIMKVVVLAALAPFLVAAFMRWVRHETQQTPARETRDQVAQRYRTAYHRSRARWRPNEQPETVARASRHRPGLSVVRGSRRPGHPS